jgi:hypothetical protein
VPLVLVSARQASLQQLAAGQVLVLMPEELDLAEQ